MKGLPAILARRDADGRTELELEIGADNPWFEGHFPAMAILPGVVQIGWAAHFAHALHGLGPGVTAMEQVKFRRPILPGARVTLELRPDEAKGRLRYEYRAGGESCSSGTLVFGGDA